LEKIGHAILDYILKVLLATGMQLLILLGPLLLLAIFMHFIARWSENLSYKLFGRTIYLYVFGWLGTSVHEIGHALFALLFGHKITDMVLFSPNATTGTLGYVSHSYNKKSIYQNIGNFFIGIGPILFGSIVLYIATLCVYQSNIAQHSVAISIDSVSNVTNLQATIMQVGSSIYRYFKMVVTGANMTWWRIVILTYLLYSIGSSITLSRPDIIGTAKGFIYFVIVLLIFNVATLWIGNFMVVVFAKIGSFFSVLYFLMIVSMVVNLLFIIALLLLYSVKSIFVKQSSF